VILLLFGLDGRQAALEADSPHCRCFVGALDFRSELGFVGLEEICKLGATIVKCVFGRLPAPESAPADFVVLIVALRAGFENHLLASI
jgi:hypothetical protein